MVAEEEPRELSSQEALKVDRYLWIARAFSGIAILAIVSNVLIFAALGSLYPLIRVQPFYLEVLDNDEQRVEIRPIGEKEMRSEMAEGALVRQYVMARYTVTMDHKELEERWGPDGLVYSMSKKDVFDEFTENHVEQIRQDIENDNLTMDVFITNASRSYVGQTYSVWDVNVRLRKMRQSSSQPEIEYRIEKIQVQYDPLYQKAGRITWRDRLKNPLGFRVLTYGSHPATAQEIKDMEAQLNSIKK